MRNILQEKTLIKTLVALTLCLNVLNVVTITLILGMLTESIFYKTLTESILVNSLIQLFYILLGLVSVITTIKKWGNNTSWYQNIVFSLYTALLLIADLFAFFAVHGDTNGSGIWSAQFFFSPFLFLSLLFLLTYTFEKKSNFLNIILFLLLVASMISLILGFYGIMLGGF